MVTICSVCRQTPCHPRCPNYDPKQDAVYVCSDCGEYILEGEEYIETLAGPIHADCAEGMILSELLTLLGERILTAEKEDY